MILKEVLECDDLVSRFQVLVGRIKEEYLRFWQAHAPHYTDHGESHCACIEKNLEELIPEPVKKDLSEYEVFFLLCSVWLHDIGIMVCEIGQSIEEVRETHHHRCIKIIKEKFSDLLNEHERTIVGEIARAHREIKLSTLDESRTIRHPILGDQKIRIRFLAALLRLADSCDMCFTRAKTDVSSWPEEARFYHLLHRRVSGIDFMHGTATLKINMLARKDSDKEVLREFVTNKLRTELESVQGTLMKNGINYFLEESFSEPTEPQPEIEVPPEILEEWKKSISGEIIFFIFRGDPINAFESCKKLHCIGGKIQLEIAMEISRLFEKKRYYEPAVDILNLGLKLYPDNLILLSHLGFIKAEYLFDWKGSYECYKKVSESRPEDENLKLNYAEALILNEKYSDAYRIATEVCKTTSSLKFLINAKLIQIWSLCLMNEEVDKGLEIIRSLVNFMPKEFQKHNTWVYNAISKFLRESGLQPQTKNMLLDLISVIKGEKSIEEFKHSFLNKK